jgi:hypothetical protein
VTGVGADAATVHAGFFINEPTMITPEYGPPYQMTVSLVINPIWGLERSDEAGNVINDYNPDITYTEIAGIEAGSLRLHIRQGGIMSPHEDCTPIAEAVYADLVTPNQVLVPNLQGDEWIIEVPEFSQFLLIALEKGCAAKSN